MGGYTRLEAAARRDASPPALSGDGWVRPCAGAFRPRGAAGQALQLFATRKIVEQQEARAAPPTGAPN
eukprot:2842112-Pyramimonas_sp.AAC.1